MNWLIASTILTVGCVLILIGYLFSIGWFEIFMIFVFLGSWIGAIGMYFRAEIWSWFDNRFL